jgi:hypothetical protein
MNQDVIEDYVMKPVISAEIYQCNVLFCDSLHSESDDLRFNAMFSRNKGSLALTYLWVSFTLHE